MRLACAGRPPRPSHGAETRDGSSALPAPPRMGLAYPLRGQPPPPPLPGPHRPLPSAAFSPAGLAMPAAAAPLPAPPPFFSQAAPRRYARAQGSRCASAKTTAGRGGRVVGQGQASTAHCGHIPRRKCSFTNVSRAERLLPNIDERRALTAQPAELQCC